MQVKNIRKNYTVLPSDKFLFVHTAVPITITVPKQIPNDVSFIILGSGTESSNNITIAYPNQSDTVVNTDNSITVITHNGNDLYSVNSGGAGVVSQFIFENATSLQLGLAQADNISISSSNKPLTSATTFNASHNGGAQIISDNSLKISIPSLATAQVGDVLTLTDTLTGEVQFTPSILKTKKITGIDCETWSAGVEIEPTKTGVIFIPISAFLVAEDNHTPSTITANINSSIGANPNFVASLATSLSTGDNVNFCLFSNQINEFKDDLYLYGNDFLNAGNVTLYVTYQEIAL